MERTKRNPLTARAKVALVRAKRSLALSHERLGAAQRAVTDAENDLKVAEYHYSLQQKRGEQQPSASSDTKEDAPHA